MAACAQKSHKLMQFNQFNFKFNCCAGKYEQVQNSQFKNNMQLQEYLVKTFHLLLTETTKNCPMLKLNEKKGWVLQECVHWDWECAKMLMWCLSWLFSLCFHSIAAFFGIERVATTVFNKPKTRTELKRDRETTLSVPTGPKVRLWGVKYKVLKSDKLLIYFSVIFSVMSVSTYCLASCH